MRNRKKILVVDDSRVEQKLIQNFLEKEGFTIFIAPTVSEGLYILGNNDIGVVLVDFYLAGINTGKALVDKLKKYNIDVLIYAISSSEENNRELFDAGCNGIIPKDPKKIQQFLNESIKTWADHKGLPG
jgi:CheY-like chemotaxis protein